MSYKLTSRAERLIDEFNEAKSARHAAEQYNNHMIEMHRSCDD
jgi:hypothetical protein